MKLFSRKRAGEAEEIEEVEVEEPAPEPADEQLSLEIPEPEPVKAEAAEEDEDDEAVDDGIAERAKAKRKTAAAAAPRPVRTDSSGPSTWVLAGLGVLVLALGVAAFVLRGKAGDQASEDDVNRARNTAALAAQHISSWDYKTLETDTKQVLGEATGDFKTAYEKSAAKLLATAPDQQAVVVGTVSKAGVETAKPGEVKVLVFLNQTTTKKDADPRIDYHRLRLTMVERGDDWLVSKLEVL